VRAILALAEKATLHPSAMGEGDVRELRAAGWGDREIHDAVQVAAYFNYINRVADCLGVDLEPEMLPPPRGGDGPG
jgi:alkylhydroperoxidase family enzyme